MARRTKGSAGWAQRRCARDLYDPEPDTDGAAQLQALGVLGRLLGALPYRRLQPGDREVLCGSFFPDVDRYLRLMAQQVEQRPDLFAPGLALRLRRKQQRLFGWTQLRPLLQRLLVQAEDSEIRERAELLSLCNQIEADEQSDVGRVPLVLQRERAAQLLLPRSVRVEVQQRRQEVRQRRQRERAAQAEAQRGGQEDARAAPAKARKGRGLRHPAQSLADWQTREELAGILGRRDPRWDQRR